MGFWQLNTAGAVALCADRTALKAIDTSEHQVAYLMEGDRNGWFRFRSGDFSAFVTADTLEGIYVKATDTASSAGCWVRDFTGWANVRWFGALGNNSAADLAALQAATDLCDAVFIPRGTYKTNGPWLLDDYAALHFESRAAIVECSASSAVVRARGYTSTRNFHIEIHSGHLKSTGKSGAYGIDFLSASMCKVFGTFISYCSYAVQNGGPGSQGAFYNEFHGVDISFVNTGYLNGTLGNSNTAFGGRVVDCTIGTDDDDNSCNTYNTVAIEYVVTSCHRVSNTTDTAQRTRFLSSRMENASDLSGTGTGIDIRSAAQATVIVAEFYTGLNTAISDLGSNTDHLAAY